MEVQESVSRSKGSEEKGRFAALPENVQREIKRYLQLGDFPTAKRIYDQFINLQTEGGVQ